MIISQLAFACSGATAARVTRLMCTLQPLAVTSTRGSRRPRKLTQQEREEAAEAAAAALADPGLEAGLYIINRAGYAHVWRSRGRAARN